MNASYWKNKKVIVTGAGGFIGRHMVQFLAENGADVTTIVSTRSKKSVQDTKNIRTLVVDLQDRNDTMQALEGADAVFHFAGLDGGAVYKHAHAHDILQVNTRIALNILEASKVQKISRLLVMSSIEVYPRKISGQIDEQSGVGNWFYEDVTGYAWVKRYTEILAKYYHDENSLRIAIARVGNVYGPGDDVSKGRVIPTFLHLAKDGKQIVVTAPKDMKVAFIYVDDLVRALALLLEVYAIGEPVNIIGSHSIDLYSLAEKIITITKSSSTIRYKPSEMKPIARKYSNKKFISRTKFKENFTVDSGIRAMCDGV